MKRYKVWLEIEEWDDEADTYERCMGLPDPVGDWGTLADATQLLTSILRTFDPSSLEASDMAFKHLCSSCGRCMGGCGELLGCDGRFTLHAEECELVA